MCNNDRQIHVQVYVSVDHDDDDICASGSDGYDTDNDDDDDADRISHHSTTCLCFLISGMTSFVHVSAVNSIDPILEPHAETVMDWLGAYS